MKLLRVLLFTAAAAGVGSTALAQSNIEKLGQFRTTGVRDFPMVEQGGERSEALQKIAERINVPDGFKVSLYGIVPDARHMALAPQGTVLFVGTKKTDVWAVSDRDRNRVADEVKRFAPSIEFDVPNGVCFSPDGFLFVAERNRVLMLPAAEFFYESPDVVVVPIIPQGELIPVEEESYNHTARVCKVGSDDKIYISLGQPFNVPSAEKLDLYRQKGLGGIIRINREGTGREVYSYGVRNSVGHDFRASRKMTRLA